MNILTKISAVVLLVIVLAAAPVFIKMAMVAPETAGQLRESRDGLAAAEQAARHAELALQSAQQQRDRFQEALAASQSAHAADLDRLQSEIQQKELANTRLQGELTSLKETLAGLQAGFDAINQRLAFAQEKLEEYRSRFADAQEQNRLLSSDLAAARLSQDRTEQLIAKLREDLASKEDQIRRLEQTLARGGSSAETADEAVGDLLPGPVAEVDLRGTITAVEDDVASINIGSAKGVRKGMRLVVYRDSQFVGFLQVQLVYPDAAAGIIVEKRLEPMQGDKVKTRQENS